MDIFELINQSIKALTLNKMRTGLAALGIIIGIGSVIALISLGEGSQQAVSAQIQSLGANLLTIIPGAQSTGAVRGAAGSTTTLTLDDAKAVQTSPEITTIQTVSPEYSKRTQVTAGRNNTNTSVIGVWPAYAEVHKISLSEGAFINQKDVDSLSKVAVIGPQVVSDLFGNQDPVGQQIRANGQLLTVVGVTVSKGGT